VILLTEFIYSQRSSAKVEVFNSDSPENEFTFYVENMTSRIFGGVKLCILPRNKIDGKKDVVKCLYLMDVGNYLLTGNENFLKPMSQLPSGSIRLTQLKWKCLG
jgi:hypothetical protein